MRAHRLAALNGWILAAGWIKDVGGQTRDEIAHYLLLAAIGMVAGHLTMGNMASRLGRAGVAPSYVVGIGVGVAIMVHASFVVGFLGVQPLIWLLFGIIINSYPAGGGRYKPEGYTIAFGVTTVLQVIGRVWFFRRLSRLKYG